MLVFGYFFSLVCQIRKWSPKNRKSQANVFHVGKTKVFRLIDFHCIFQPPKKLTWYHLKNLKYLFQYWTKNLVRSEKSFPMIRIHASAFLLKQYPGVSRKTQHKRNWWYTTRARIKLMQSLVCFYDVKKCKCTSYNEMFNWTWL